MNYWTQCNLLRLHLRRRYNKNRAIIELRSIADHCACTIAWSQRSWSLDRPVRTVDIIKAPSCALCRPVSFRWSKTGKCERSLREGAPGIQWIRGWMRPRNSLDALENISTPLAGSQTAILRGPVRSLVTIPTVLYRLLFFAFCISLFLTCIFPGYVTA